MGGAMKSLQRVLRFFRREDAEEYARLFGGRVRKPWWSHFWRVKS